jgi:hypothetical protein
LWKRTTFWSEDFFTDEIKFYEIDGKVPNDKQNGYIEEHDIYHLPEWIIKEDDTEEKYRKCITR